MPKQQPKPNPIATGRDFPLGKAELRRLLRLFNSIAGSTEVRTVLRTAFKVDQQFGALIRREARSQGMTVRELEIESGERITEWNNPSFNKVVNVLDTLGYNLIAVPNQDILEMRNRTTQIAQPGQLRAAFLGAPNHILTREYLSSILYPYEEPRNKNNYKIIDIILVKMRKEYPDIANNIKTHWGGGWEYTPGEIQVRNRGPKKGIARPKLK